MKSIKDRIPGAPPHHHPAGEWPSILDMQLVELKYHSRFLYFRSLLTPGQFFPEKKIVFLHFLLFDI